MIEKVREILENNLPPTVNLDSQFLFSELDSLSVTLILTVLSDEFKIKLESTDATPGNLMSVESIAKLVESKLAEK